MSTSTDALLIYGYIWDDEYDLFDDGDTDEIRGDWEDRIAAAAGLVNPWDRFPEEIDRLPRDQRTAQANAWKAEHRAELDAWYEAQRRAVSSYGVTVDHHGSDEWSCPIVKITDAGKTASRGYPLLVTGEDLQVGGNWNDKLTRFVTDLGIDVSEAKGPGWFIVSYWG
jgi:hypothetical protein